MQEIVAQYAAQINAAYATTSDRVFATAITPKGQWSTLRIAVAVTTSRIPQLVGISSSASVVMNLGSGMSIPASSLYTFIAPAIGSWQYNLAFSGSTTIQHGTVEEVYGGMI